VISTAINVAVDVIAKGGDIKTADSETLETREE
jgi:hypothetical protein